MMAVLRSIVPQDLLYASNLFVTFHANPLIRADTRVLSSTYGKHTKLLAYAGDIENMYNRLPIAEVEMGVRYCLWRAQRKLRFQNEFVLVNRRSPMLSKAANMNLMNKIQVARIRLPFTSYINSAVMI